MIVEVGKLGQADFSDDKVYRYRLTRGRAGAHRSITFLMLNPSTANHDENDPTITRCISFAHRERARFVPPLLECDLGITIVNLFAFRSPEPRECFACQTPIGGQANDDAILLACRSAEMVIAAWGAAPKARKRAMIVRAMLKANGIRLHRFTPPWFANVKKGTRFDYPPHPLFLNGDTPIEAWK